MRGAEQDYRASFDSQGRSGPFFLPHRVKIGCVIEVMTGDGGLSKGKSVRGVDIPGFCRSCHACW